MAEKPIAYYDPRMRPSPLTLNIDGMWITKKEPYLVTRVWQVESERPRLGDEPLDIKAYTASRARKLFCFEPIKKRNTSSKRV